MSAMKKKLLFIVNPVSGRVMHHRSLADAIHALEEADYEVTTYLTEKRGDATEMAATMGAYYDLVVCLGGDGTLSETVNGLNRIDFCVPLGYIPAGSTNDFAMSLDLSTNIIESARDIARGVCREVDVTRLGERCFVNAAITGIFSSVAYSTPQDMKNSLGFLAYVLNGVKDLNKLRATHMRIVTDSQVCEGDYLFAAVCNSSGLGGAFSFPEGCGRSDDGKFEALFVKKPSRLGDLEKIIGQLLSAQYRPENIDFIQSDAMTVETLESMPWAVDGEALEPGYCHPFEVMPKRLALLVRPGTPMGPQAWTKKIGRWLEFDAGRAGLH